tara:strand:+ start:2011 stop:2316 length:306 start_codon:yes stop_codon:yes gene_type:complete
MEHQYMYVLVRNDLSGPQKAVQSAHAAIEASRAFIKPGEEHPSVIIVTVKSEQKLKNIADKLGVKYRAFFEPDIGNQMTAIATEPIHGEQRKFFRKFQLMK